MMRGALRSPRPLGDWHRSQCGKTQNCSFNVSKTKPQLTGRIGLPASISVVSGNRYVAQVPDTALAVS